MSVSLILLCQYFHLYHILDSIYNDIMWYLSLAYFASIVAQLVKNLPVMWETWGRSLGWEDPLEKEKATDSSILDWRIPWTVQFMGSQRVRHD